MHRSVFLSAVVISFVLFSGVVPASELMIADFSAGSLQGWQVKEVKGTADAAAVKDDGISAVRLRSARTSFSLQKEVNVDLNRTPLLSWKWKVTKLPAGGDFRRSATDDQAAQLFVAFSRKRAIVYIWDTTAAKDTMADAAAPFFMSLKAVVVRSGASHVGRWLTETRNVRDDYRALFHEEPGPVSGIRLQINSQHTGTSAESFFADIAFRSL